NVITAQEFYRLLVFNYKIKSLTGNIKFKLGNISIGVERRDLIGEILQRWVCEFLTRARVDFLPNHLPQNSPDIYLNPKNLRTNWLEIKAFNRADNPRFSIAAFNFFVEDCIKRPWHLYADYLIFGYNMNIETGDFKIKDLWLKKIWEITKPMKKWPLTVKTNGGSIREIRPCTWYAERTKIKVFENLGDFLSSLEAAIFQNPDTQNKAFTWRETFLKNYKNYYGYEIKIPKWNDIKYKYGKGN
ncbi:MAG: NgoBV family restriction endonuclease, partial [Synergistaceae bacterium]|nr:NgoBV family restriction endonuclease [Synergistaceae bacterium]